MAGARMSVPSTVCIGCATGAESAARLLAWMRQRTQYSPWRSTRTAQVSIQPTPGCPQDDFIAARSEKLVKLGKTFVINGTVYFRTKAGLVPQ
jgi:hypothetical protein